MTQWSRSRLRSFGIGASVFLGGSLLIAPSASPVVAAPPTAPIGAPSDVLSVVPEGDNRSAFRYSAASGDTEKPIGFVSTGGMVRVQPLGENAQPALKAKTGAPAAAAAVTTADATYRTTIRSIRRTGLLGASRSTCGTATPGPTCLWVIRVIRSPPRRTCRPATISSARCTASTKSTATC